MRTLLTLISLALTGCAIAPNTVRQSTTPWMFEQAGGPVASVADCLGAALKRDLGLETDVQRPRPGSAEVSAWGALDRRAYLVVTLEDRRAGGMRVAVYSNRLAPFWSPPGLVIGDALTTCTSA